MKKLQFICLLLFVFSTIQAKDSTQLKFRFAKEASRFLAIEKRNTKALKARSTFSSVEKTIHVTSAGSLATLLSDSEKSSITKLTITGNIDARDFVTLRDSMPSLTTIDMGAANIVYYFGEVENYGYQTEYLANEIPDRALSAMSEEPGEFLSILTSVILPASTTSIGEMAFSFCNAMTSISISSKITKIGVFAFVGCGAKINVDNANLQYSSSDGVLFDKSKNTLIQCPQSAIGHFVIPTSVKTVEPYSFCFNDNLASVSIPSSVMSIGEYAFTACSAAIFVDANNTNYMSQDSLLFNKSKNRLIQCGTSKIGNYVIPSTVDTIGENAFYNCKSLTSVSLPASVASISDLAFYNCTGLTSITVNGLPVLIDSSDGVFENVDKINCILNVPFGTTQLYQYADGWNDFKNIVENETGFALESNKSLLSYLAGSKAKIAIASNKSWTVSSNQNWLQASPANGMGNDTIVLVADANLVTENRNATVTVSAEGVQPQTITVTQAGFPKAITVVAGGLATTLSASELNSIINLKITGTIDARDFKTMRDNMPALSFLDISEATIAAYNGTLGTTAWITNYAANKIPDYAFNLGMSYQQLTLTDVKLPTSINAIGDYAFYSCEALTEIEIPNSVTFIGRGGFGSCYNLAKITLPNNLTSIGNEVFMGSGISEITLPNTLISIGDNGFAYCKNLKTVVIPNSVQTLYTNSFQNCESLQNLTIGNSVKNIRNSAFMECKSLKSLIIPNSVTNIDGYAFGNCIGLETVTLSDSLTAINYGCFQGCIKLNNIVIPQSVTRIDYNAFSGCKSLTDIQIPEAVTIISGSAFSYCTGLKSISVVNEIPIDLSSSYGVFDGVNKQECILNVPFGTKSAYSTAIQWKDFVNIIENSYGLSLSTNVVKLSVSEGSKAAIAVKSNNEWTVSNSQSWLNISPLNGNGNDTIRFTAQENQLTVQRTAIVTVTSGKISKKITVTQAASPKVIAITEGKLATALTTEERKTITNLTITGKIDARDFKTLRDSMPKLELLDISNTEIVAYSGNEGTYGNYYSTYPANEIPQYAFYKSNTYTPTKTLYSIILPNTAKSIGYSAFQLCAGLNEIVVPNAVTSIGSYAFSQCSGLKTISLSSKITKISYNAFDGCTGITDLVLPDSLVTVDNDAFVNCTNLKNVTLGSSLKTVGYNMFQNCTSLSNVVFSKALKTIGIGAFRNTGFTAITLPETITKLDSYAFSSCTKLEEINLPNSLTSIEYAAFGSCTELKKILFGKSLISIGSGAFTNCTSLPSIDIPESVNSIESSAFNGCSGLLSITANALTPVDLSNSSSVFYGVDKTLCSLNVPFQSKALYAVASQWKDFTNIIENPNQLELSIKTARISYKAGSSAGFTLTSNTNWTASSDQSWLSINAESGNGSATLTLTATENTDLKIREAIVKVMVAGVNEKIIRVTQMAGAKTIEITAGTLSTSLTPTELNLVSNLILTGTIDARDFKTMRDNMPMLADVDLNGTKILAYSGTGGTSGNYTYSYPAATIPQYALSYNGNGKQSLVSISLPDSTVTIGQNAFQKCSGLSNVSLSKKLAKIDHYAFQYCTALSKITLPNSLLTLGVYSFAECSLLSMINLSDSLVTISDYAFSNCVLLPKISIPNSVTTLGSYVFRNCTSLTEVTLGSGLKSTGNGTFSNCKALDSITIPGTYTSIGTSSFESCSKLSNVKIGNGVTSIESSAFNGCSSIETIEIPTNVKTIGYSAFGGCSKIKNINLSSSITSIASNTFGYCTSLTEVVLPNTITEIKSGAFSNCSALKNITFSSALTIIEGSAFSNCTTLVDVVIPKKVTTLGTSTFSNCTGLKSITLPASISSLGYNSINCSGLKAIYSLATSPLILGYDNVFGSVDKSTCVLHVPTGSKKEYQAAVQWKDFQNISEEFDFFFENRTIRIKSGGGYTIDIPTNKTFTVESSDTWLQASIEPNGENYKIVLTSDINPEISLRTAALNISFTNGLTRQFTIIQSGATKSVTVSSGNLRNVLTATELKTLTSLTLSGTIDATDFRVMRDSMPLLADIDLKNVTITAYSGSEGTNASVINYLANETPINAFYKTYTGVGKESLASIILPDNITSIAKSSFAYAANLQSIAIPGLVTTISETAFARCEGLEEVTFGNSVTTIGVEAFWICTKLKGITLPNSVITIGAEAFSNCSSLKWANLPDNLTTLGSDAFSVCRKLSSIELPNTITSLGDDVFAYCSSLTKANIPDKIEELKYGIFYGCTSLKEITIPAAVKTIGPRVFGKCSSLTTIAIPATVTKMEYGIFEHCTGLTSIYAYQTSPIDLSASYYATVFNNVNKTSCILYVPTGSKAQYSAAIEWKDFSNIVEMTTGLANNSSLAVCIYPNPVTDKFSVLGLTENANVFVTDINGRVVLSKQINNGELISVERLPKGMFLVRVSTSTGNVEHKIIKK